MYCVLYVVPILFYQGPALPEGLLKYVLAQIAKIIPNDVDAKTKFVTSGAFEKIQILCESLEPGSELREYVDNINNCYPIEIVHYYSPGYSETLIQKLTGGKAPAAATKGGPPATASKPVAAH